MAYKAKELASYQFIPADKLLLDTNIWLLVYGPQKPGDSRVATYSGALSRILTAKSHIYIDVLIVSEFINAYARLKWNVMGKPHTDFKRFRKSADFKPVAQDIAADVKRFLQHCTRVDSGFPSLAVDTMIDEYSAGDSDFNDQILTALCKKEGLKLVTDDGDFKNQGVAVITANKKLLV